MLNSSEKNKVRLSPIEQDRAAGKASIICRLNRLQDILGDNADWIAIRKVVELELHLNGDERVRSFRINSLLHVMPYRQYLNTHHWKTTSAEAKKKAGFKCRLCNSGGELHTHHRTYENRGSEAEEDLIVLCADCHGKFHDKLPKEAEDGE